MAEAHQATLHEDENTFRSTLFLSEVFKNRVSWVSSVAAQLPGVDCLGRGCACSWTIDSLADCVETAKKAGYITSCRGEEQCIPGRGGNAEVIGTLSSTKRHGRQSSMIPRHQKRRSIHHGRHL